MELNRNRRSRERTRSCSPNDKNNKNKNSVVNAFHSNQQHYHPEKCCASTRLCWWEPDSEDVSNTVDFSQETSLHGLKFICQSQRHLAER
jgi:hypothetical protein